MDDLVQFLRDRLDEDEAAARATHPVFLNWEYDDCVREIRDFGNGNTLATGVQPRYGAFMQGHDPARVLAEVEARRQGIAHYRQVFQYAVDGADSYVKIAAALGRQIRIMASVYADHPDYREEWRP